MTQQLLDWKLDYNNETIGKNFHNESNRAHLYLSRITILITITFSFFMPLTLDAFDRYLALAISLLSWNILFFCLLFTKFADKYAGIISSLYGAGYAALTIMFNIFLPSSLLMHFANYANLMGTAVLRLRVQHFLVLFNLNFLLLVYGNRNHYAFEIRWKHDYFRSLYTHAEAEKLQWAVAVDGCLLQNIFPKNLSDELQKQVANQPKPIAQTKKTISMVQYLGSALSISSLKSSLGINSVKQNTFLSPSSISLSPLARTTSDPGPKSSNHEGSLSRISSLRQRRKKNIKDELTELKNQLNPLSVAIPKSNLSSSSTSPQSRASNSVPHSPLDSLFTIPPVVTTPKTSPKSPLITPAIYGTPRVLTSSGTPLYPPSHTPELHNFMSYARHVDGSVISLSHSYPEVSVIFADIVGFTPFSNSVSPQELVDILNDLFGKFDDIIGFHNLEKIRTVGDAYLCVGNMSIPLFNHEEQAVSAALKMISAVKKVKENLNLRVGIASGPLIAGVTGTTKWNYDIFGKPFEEATCMETLAPPNCVAVSKSIYNACKKIKGFEFSKETHNQRPYYIATNEEIEYDDQVHTQAIEESNLKMLTQTEWSNVVFNFSPAEVFDLVDMSLVTNIPVSDLKCDISQKLSYNPEIIQQEKSTLNMFSFATGFKNPDFQKQFQDGFTKITHNFTVKISGIFAITSLCFMITDMASSPTDIGIISKCCYLLSAVCMFGFSVFARKYNLRPYAFNVALFAINVFEGSFVVVSFLRPSEIHLTWSILGITFMTCWVRNQSIYLIISQAIMSCFISYTAAQTDLPFSTRCIYISGPWISVSFSLVTQFLLHKNVQLHYLSQKRVKYDIYRQKIAQYRAKLLLHNILPEDIIPRLKPSALQNNALAVVDHFECATMMFVNLTNLEELTSDLDPSHIFQIYDDIFKLFDAATTSFGLEKIKTINTVYMVASGLPKVIPNHTDMAIKLAIELYKITREFTLPKGDRKLSIRIGICSGPVVAGIIGKKKYAYDCWSDTTNTASRLESNGWNSYAQVDSKTLQLIQYQQYFQKRENLYIKGKGVMDTFVLPLSKFVK